MREAAARLLVGPSALRARVLSEDRAEVDDGGGARALVIKKTAAVKEVALWPRPWDGCAPFYSGALLRVSAGGAASGAWHAASQARAR